MSFFVSDCSEEETAEVLFVNTNDNITFNINKLLIGKARKFYMYHNGKEVGILYPLKYLLRQIAQMDYYKRTLFHTVPRDSNQTDSYITILGAKRSDNGTYLFVDAERSYYVCFAVFVYDYTPTIATTTKITQNNLPVSAETPFITNAAEVTQKNLPVSEERPITKPATAITQYYSSVSAETPASTIAAKITQKCISALEETPQNYTPVAIVGAVLGTALLLALILIVYLLRRRNSSATNNQISAASQLEVPVEMATQNTTYEELRHDTSTGQTYDALTADQMNAGRDKESRNEIVQPSAEYIDVLPPNDCYENAVINN